MPRKSISVENVAIADEMREEDFWNVAFSHDLRKVKDPEVKECMIHFRSVSKKLAKLVGYEL